MTQDALSTYVVCSPTLICHIEAGRRLPNPEDAARIDQALGTDGWFVRWLEDLERRYAHYFSEVKELEPHATEIRQFGALLVPGLLQTDRYAWAVFQAYSPNYTAETIDHRVVKRMERAHILENPDAPVVWTVLDEAVLRRRVGGGPVMAEQLTKIADLAETGRLRLHVIPFDRGAHSLMEGAVTLMSFRDTAPTGYVEGILTGQLIDDPEQLSECRTAYDVALSDALSRAESLALTRTIAKEHGNEQ